MQNSLNITILPAFGDNYIYLAEYAPEKYFVVDPGDAKSVLDALNSRADTTGHAELTHILTTHHHTDHIGGVRTLKQHTGCVVVGPKDTRIDDIDTAVEDGDTMPTGDINVRCIATPGHTATSVCYYVSGDSLTQPVLFTGDTLFVCGCGRMFECDGETMYQSLQNLTVLPDETLVYPGHDYTEENVRFALMFDPENPQLAEKLAVVRDQNRSGLPTVPSVLSEERRLNPFLRAKDWQTFAILRGKKDVF